MSILLDRVDEERIKLDLTGAGLELSKAWNKMLEKVKKANSNRKGNEYFIVDLIVACDNGGLTSNKYKAGAITLHPIICTSLLDIFRRYHML